MCLYEIYDLPGRGAPQVEFWVMRNDKDNKNMNY